MKSYSCIIPIFNERPRIIDVLKSVIKVKEIKEIICVDDGSMDDSARVIVEFFPQVLLLKHKLNLGKTMAILSGARIAKLETILLLDSDLTRLSDKEISRAFLAFEKNELDCLLLNTAPTNYTDHILRGLFRFLLLATGNRIISRDCLLKALKSGGFDSYDLEIALNEYLMETKKKVAYLDISAKGVSKISKEGWIKGGLHEIKMWSQIINYGGLEYFLKQSFLFPKKKVS